MSGNIKDYDKDEKEIESDRVLLENLDLTPGTKLLLLLASNGGWGG